MEFEKIRDIICEVLSLEPEEITKGSNFVDDLGADSLEVYQIILAAEEEYEIEIPQDDADKVKTVGDIVDLVKSLIQ